MVVGQQLAMQVRQASCGGLEMIELPALDVCLECYTADGALSDVAQQCDGLQHDPLHPWPTI
jgi:hypothetical protein